MLTAIALITAWDNDDVDGWTAITVDVSSPREWEAIACAFAQLTGYFAEKAATAQEALRHMLDASDTTEVSARQTIRAAAAQVVRGEFGTTGI